MLCRVADSLFWLSRYIERAESTARMVDVYLQMMLEMDSKNADVVNQHWSPILQSMGDLKFFHTQYDEINQTTVPDFLTLNLKNPSSILSCIYAARENARQIRDQISSMMWESINTLYLDLKSMDIKAVWKRDPSAFYNQIKDRIYHFNGLTHATFPRREGFQFIECGKYLERADKTGRLLDIKYYLLLPENEQVGGSVDTAQWIAILRACNGMEAFLHEQTEGISPNTVSEFLIQSPYFPAQYISCLQATQRHIHSLSKVALSHYSNEVERMCGQLVSKIKYDRQDDIINYGMHEYLDDVHNHIEKISVELSKQYMFSPIVDPTANLQEA